MLPINRTPAPPAEPVTEIQTVNPARLWKPWSQELQAERRRRGRREGYWPAVWVIGAAAAGIVLDRYAATAGLGAAASLLLLLGWWFTWWRGRPQLAAVLLLASVAFTAGAWHHNHWRVFPANDLGRHASRQPSPVCFEAVALTAPALQAPAPRSAYRAIPQLEKTKLLVRPTRLRDGEAWLPVDGRCDLMVDGHLVAVRSGDRLKVFGQLSRPPRATNPGQFDAGLHNRVDRELCRVRVSSPEAVQIVRRGPGLWPQHFFEQIRATGLATLDRTLPPKQAGLMAAMLLGEQGRTPPATADLFRRTGAMHVLVVSGLHVGLVLGAGLFAMRMGWVPRRRAIVLLMLVAAGYAAITGGRPPVVRAVVLAEIACTAALLGRRVVSFNSLAAAAAVVLAINPCELFQSGTQLSFLATATLIAYGSRVFERRGDDPLDRLIASVQPWWRRGLAGLGSGAWLLLSATLVVWLVSAPLLLSRFNLLAPGAVPASLAVFPLVAVAVTSALALAVVGSVAPWIATPLAFVASSAVWLLEETLEIVDAIPAATLWSPSPAWWWTLGAYGLMGAGLAVRDSPVWLRRVLRTGVFWLPTAFLPLAFDRGRAESFKATFIDIGHGVSVVIETPERAVLLYDAGSLASPEQASKTIAGLLWDRGHTRIDAVVLSHADVDHYNALPGLLERFTIGGVFAWPSMIPRPPIDADDHSGPAMLSRLLARHGVPIHPLVMGDRLHVGSLTADVLHPTRMGVIGSDNANSLVLGVEAAGHRLLLPGDLEQEGLKKVVEQEPYDCDLLLAPHHGSSRSDPPGFANWCRPEHVIISGGARSADAGVSYAAAGARVLRTHEVGAISARLSSEKGLKIRPARPNPTESWFAR